MWHWAFVVLAVSSPVLAQIFTCSDAVTVCLVGVETCCCAPAALCACCEPAEQCANGTCALPSASPTRSATPSTSPSHSATASASPTPSSPPNDTPCVQLDATSVTCTAPLDAQRVILPDNVTTVLGDLEIGVNAVLVVSAPIQVQSGTAVVRGTIEAGAGVFANVTVRDGDFVPVISTTGGQLVVAQNASILVSDVPKAERECARARANAAEQRGSNFGVVFSVDERSCDSASSSSSAGGLQWTYTTLVPALAASCAVCTCICVVIVTVVAASVFWRRIRSALWARDADFDRDQIVHGSD